MSGQWTRWATQFGWVERTIAFDLEIADHQRAQRAEQRDALEEQRFQVELRSQKDLEDRYEQIGRTLDRYHAAPISDITQEKDEVVEGKRIRTITRVRGVRGGDFEEQTNYRRHAILGLREKDSSVVEIFKADHVFWKSTKNVA